jgi:DnaD/phage-associated family protein
MPKIQDIAELKVALYVLYLIQCKQGHPCFVTYEELKAVSCQLSAELDEETIRRALNSAINHGSLLHSTLKINGECEDVYLTNTESNKKLAKSIECGEFPLERTMSEKKEIKHNIFALYEQNIGIITPMIAEELKEAGKLYPAQWIDEAFKEAVVMNKRSWKYIARILERWASEGKESGAHRRSIKKGSPDKYIKGKYGHLVKR